MNLPRFTTVLAFLTASAIFAESAVAQIQPPASPWTLADYAEHDSASFRQHAPASQPLPDHNVDTDLLAAAIFFVSNEQRVIHKVPQFSHSSALHRAAQSHSHQMAIAGFFSHNNPYVPTRRTPSQRMKAEGVSGGYHAENIASTTAKRHTYLSAADAIITMWMKSPGHRKNLLNPRLLHLGCGAQISRQPGFKLLATQNFASKVPEEKPKPLNLHIEKNQQNQQP